MTRRFILTTATLATFLTSGGATVPTFQSPTTASRTRSSAALHPHTAEARDATIVALGPHLVGVAGQGPVVAGREWPVALFLDGALDPDSALSLWIGRKNAWGSQVARAQPAMDLSGWFTAQVPAPDQLHPDMRLWLGLDHGDGPMVRSGMPLPA